MDPITLAPAVLTVLLPYLVKAGERTAEKIGERLPEYAEKLWTTLTGKFKDPEAAKDLITTPEDEDTQAAFRQQIKKALTEDPALLAAVAALLEQAQQESMKNSTASSYRHASVNVGGNVDGNIVVGNNNAVNSNPRKR